MRTSLILTLILSPLWTLAQDYPVFPDAMAVWTNTYTNFNYVGTFPDFTGIDVTNVDETHFHLNNLDTLIGNHSYSQLFLEDSIYVGGLRTEDQKVYFTLHGDTLEYLLYDFGAEVGDIIQDVFTAYDGSALNGSSDFELLDYSVYDIDSVMCEDGLYHKRLLVSHDDGLEWIEGVGSTGGLFWWAGANVSTYFVDLGRLCVNEQAIYLNSEVDQFLQDTTDICSSEYYVSSIDAYERGGLSLYPNPASESIVIREELLSQEAVFVLKDTAGRTIREINLSMTQQGLIDLSGCAKGMYIALVQDQRRSYTTVLVIE